MNLPKYEKNKTDFDRAFVPVKVCGHNMTGLANNQCPIKDIDYDCYECIYG